MRRCMGCMKEYDGTTDVCPFCGYVYGSPAEKISQLKPSTVLAERYIVGKSIGHGGFGITYIGWDKKLQKEIAIKEYMPDMLAIRSGEGNNVKGYNEEAEKKFEIGVKRVLDESRRLARLTGVSGIVRVYDCFEANNTAYIIMELLNGITLKERLRDAGSLSFEETVAIMLPVLKALSATHKANIIHRDIAPDNIFLCKGGKVKLIDFGAASTASDMGDMNGAVVLKPGYAPVEQYSNRGRQGPCVDIYAVCATMYRMLTGAVPPESLIRRTENDTTFDVRDIPGVPEEAGFAIMKGMSVNAEDRYQSADELYYILAESVKKSGGDEEAADPTDKTDVSSDESKKRPVLSVILSVFAVILIFVVVMLILIKKGAISTVSPVTTTTEAASEISGEALSGDCGVNLYWKFEENAGRLTITGRGEMDYSKDGVYDVDAPWYPLRERIREVVFSKDMVSVCDGAFKGCNKLSSVLIPDFVREVGKDTFKDCPSLRAIDVSKANNSYESVDGVLYDNAMKTLIKCPEGLTADSVTVPDGVTDIEEGAFWGCVNLKSVTLSQDLINIGADAFKGCENLKEIIIPKDVALIGSGAFDGCVSLERITVKSSNSEYKSIDGVLFDRDGKELILYPSGRKNELYTVPDGVTTIDDGAFSECVYLKSLIIPKKVDTINGEIINGEVCTIYYYSSDAYAKTYAEEKGYEHKLRETDRYIVATESAALNLRKTPSTTGEILGTVPKGEEVRVIEFRHTDDENNPDWCRIIYDGTEGWVSRSMLTKKTVDY
ncbi:MAG: leucine-rich repeat protein [Clostridiales bacterium]|nr:leucine-rich repeat protein [Clostridiales bacterium]